MKIYHILALAICSFVLNSLHAEEALKWPTESSVIDTGWVNSDPTASCPKTHYPVCVEIMPLEGDGVRYKAIFIPKPNGDFDYKSTVGIRTEEYEKLSKDLGAKGFIQISHQVVTLMDGNTHQSVWVSRAKREPVAPSPIARLQAMWSDELSKRDAFKSHNQQLGQQLFESERIIVREVTGDEAFRRVDGTLLPSERSLILTGDLAALRKQPKLTEIHHPGSIGNGFSAYLTPDGTLLLLWIIPEG